MWLKAGFDAWLPTIKLLDLRHITYRQILFPHLQNGESDTKLNKCSSLLMTENSSLTSDLQGLSILRNDRKGGKYQLLTSVECEHRPHWRELQATVALQVTTKLVMAGQGREK